VTGIAHARLDQWLWAARFYKTRSQAKAAIEGGKVHVDGARAKPSREVTVGMRIEVSRDREQIEVTVHALGVRRGDAARAAALYVETAESAERRAAAAESRRLTRASYIAPPGRPDKRDRRALERLKYGPADDP
jgi:ribosome-associated heat shock protein Hsp15